MKTKPETLKQKYLFLVDDQELAFAVIAAGYYAVALLPERDGYYDIESFVTYMVEIACTRTYQTDYCYVPPDLNKFHKFNEQEKRIDVFDMEIVDNLIQTVPFLCSEKRRISIYEHGCYYEDRKGIRLKAKIQKLIFRECITAKIIQNIYNLLVPQPQVHKWFSDMNNQPSHWINFQNVFFDVMEWKMIEHNPKYLTINQIPFSFYPEQAETVLSGRCSHMRKVLRKVLSAIGYVSFFLWILLHIVCKSCLWIFFKWN